MIMIISLKSFLFLSPTYNQKIKYFIHAEIKETSFLKYFLLISKIHSSHFVKFYHKSQRIHIKKEKNKFKKCSNLFFSSLSYFYYIF